MSVAREHFRTAFGPGDLKTLKAKENKRHQASELVLDVASFMRWERLLATAARAGLGMSLMVFVDALSCDNPVLGMSSGGPSLNFTVSFSVPFPVFFFVERACDWGCSFPRHTSHCQMVRALA